MLCHRQDTPGYWQGSQCHATVSLPDLSERVSFSFLKLLAKGNPTVVGNAKSCWSSSGLKAKPIIEQREFWKDP